MVGGDNGWLSDFGDSLLALLIRTALFLALLAAVVAALVVVLLLTVEIRLILLFVLVVLADLWFAPGGGYSCGDVNSN